MSWQAFALGIVGLALLEAVLSSDTAVSRAGSLLAFPTRAVDALVNPTTTLWGAPIKGSNLATPQTPANASPALTYPQGITAPPAQLN